MTHNPPAATAHTAAEPAAEPAGDRGDRAATQPLCASQGPSTPDPETQR